MGGVHGDEPEGVTLAEAAGQWLHEETLKQNPQLSPWIVIPCLNPDGIQNKTRTNGNGVDLNRNYPSRDWSAEYSQPRYHPGSHPGSEPEIQGLLSLIQKHQPKMIIHCHAWQPCIVYAGAPARSAAEALGRSSGYEVRDDIGYPTPGSLSRYGWFDQKIPIICIEEQEHTSAEKIWPHFSQGIQEIFLHLHKELP